MSLFTEIEGLSGENLSSALLKFLLINSSEVREKVLHVLSDNSPPTVGPFGWVNHFACRTEYQTHDGNGDNAGRIDLLIQTDDVVIGIENKFYAPFQGDQPRKYLGSLQRAAEALGQINQCNAKAVMFVICPESRFGEAKNAIECLNNVAVITWEKLLNVFKGLNPNQLSNALARSVLVEFIRFLDEYFEFIRDFPRKHPHYFNAFPDYGSPTQNELVARLWPLFHSSGRRLGSGRTWTGYYFYNDTRTEHKGWYGFVPKSEIQGFNTKEASFVIASTNRPAQLGPEYREVKLVNDKFIGEPGKTHAWVLEFNNDWTEFDKWRTVLQPFQVPPPDLNDTSA